MRFITRLGGACLCTLWFAIGAYAEERTSEYIEPDRERPTIR
jgi:hypothetical protein